MIINIKNFLGSILEEGPRSFYDRGPIPNIS